MSFISKFNTLRISIFIQEWVAQVCLFVCLFIYLFIYLFVFLSFQLILILLECMKDIKKKDMTAPRYSGGDILL
jgi:sensor histidine kinase YesM